MSRPLVVDATGIAHLVESGTLHDRLRALLARMEAMPVPVPDGFEEVHLQGGMPTVGYAIGRVPRFGLAVHSAQVPGAWPSTRIAAVCRAILDPATEIAVDRRRRDAVSDALSRAEAVAGAVGRAWVDAAPVPSTIHRPRGLREWTYGDGPLGDDVPHVEDRFRDPCPIPRTAIAAAFADAPHLKHLVVEGGRLKINLRWGSSGCGTLRVDAGCDDPMAVMRILSDHAHLLPRRAA